MAWFLAVPVDVAEANRLMVRWYRRYGRVRGCGLALAGVETAGRRLCGVAVLGRPVNRQLDDGWTLELLRLAWRRDPAFAQLPLWCLRPGRRRVRLSATGELYPGGGTGDCR